MKPTTFLLALFVASVQAGLSVPSLTVPTIVASLTSKTSTAATPTSSSSIPKCVLNCAGSSIASSGSKCASIQDPCVCTDPNFQTAMSNCLKNCTTAEQLAAKALEKGLCAAINSTSTNGTASATGSANSTSTANGTAATGSASQSGNSAVAVQIDFAQGIFALTVAVVGAVTGGLFI